MKNKLNNFIHNKTFTVVLTLVLITIVSIAGTYAWFTWNSAENTSLTIKIGKLADVMFASGNDITTELTPVFNYYDGEKTTFSINNRDTSGTIIKYIVKLNIASIPSELRSESVKYSIAKNGQLLTTNDLSTAEDNITIDLYSDTLPSGNTSYEFYIYIDANIENNSSMMNKTIVGNLTVEAFEFSGSTLVELISNTYNNADKTEVTNNSITYNYATDVSLMNDRLGGTTTSLDGGNIRYYGTNPNNYIDIGDVYTEDTEIDNFEKNSMLLGMFEITDRNSCYDFFDCSTNYSSISLYDGYSDEAACQVGLQKEYKVSSIDEICGVTTKKAGDPKLYRIIGMFKDVETADGTKKDLIKVIREDSIGNFAWDFKYNSSTDTPTYDNNWGTSTLQTILNNGYYKAEIGTHSYLDLLTEDIFFNVSFDLRKKGINSTIQSKIESVKWILDTIPFLDDYSNLYSDIYSDTYYKIERGEHEYISNLGITPTIWTGEIALMYPSDFSYATDFTQCSVATTSYEPTNCTGNDWLTSYANGNLSEWLLAPTFNDSSAGFALDMGLFLSASDIIVAGMGTRPSFYLKSDISVVSGDGTETKPYVVR